MSDIPFSLYVHFPWCVKKCPYCDFNSHSLANKLPELEYIDALIRDLCDEQQDEQRRHLTSIFFGGGTPSLFSGKRINQLIRQIDQWFTIDGCEITIEVNPGTFDQSNFENYRHAGVNRLSLGAQSFNQYHLEKLGRIHNPGEIFDAFAGARSAGFSRVNIDLMFGLPDQDCDNALTDLEQAIALGPEHISWYQLTVEPNTVF
ncbi:MAG: radical SAM family heme chaperone HemW, partial [Pseudomonadota bacterium]|nr:radical SAM family heme chaperone HemW [Pseudomonadota bacterium]